MGKYVIVFLLFVFFLGMCALILGQRLGLALVSALP